MTPPSAQCKPLNAVRPDEHAANFQQISGQYAGIKEMVKARDAACPMGRMGTARDIAKAALFLAR